MPLQRLAVAAARAAHGVASLRFEARGRRVREASIDPMRVAIVGHSIGATIAIRLAAAAAHGPGAYTAGGSSGAPAIRASVRRGAAHRGRQG